jgi:hypothetical protein
MRLIVRQAPLPWLVFSLACDHDTPLSNDCCLNGNTGLRIVNSFAAPRQWTC